MKWQAYYRAGKQLLNDRFYLAAREKNRSEKSKRPKRTDVINHLLTVLDRPTVYLEIGVRDPGDNFDHVEAGTKYGVDPGHEFKANPVEFKMTSNDFFSKLGRNEILSSGIRFDVIFIDGLHLAEQVDTDITNAFAHLREGGFIVLHDCNPPTEWHSREEYRYYHSPAGASWNGTTWKAFMKWRMDPAIKSCCVDTDWGVGILSKEQPIGQSIGPVNPFYEHSVLDKNRTSHLELIDFDALKRRLF